MEEEARIPGEVIHLRRFRRLQDANGRSNQLVIDLQTRQTHAVEASRKSLRLARREELAEWFQMPFHLRCLQACRLPSSVGPPGTGAVGREINRPSACGFMTSSETHHDGGGPSPSLTDTLRFDLHGMALVA